MKRYALTFFFGRGALARGLALYAGVIAYIYYVLYQIALPA